MDHDGVFKAFLGHDVLRADAPLHQLEQLDARIVSGLFKLRGGGGHQRGARQHQPRASAMICMVEAVPIKEHAPQLGQALCL